MIVAMGNAPKCLKSAVLLPVDSDLFSGTVENIWLGEYNTGKTGKRLSAAAVASQTFTIQIPWQATDWRKLYHTVYLSLPYAGVITFPASELINATSFNITCGVSQNGAVTYLVSAVGNHTVDLGYYYGNCAGAFMIGESQTSLLTSLAATSSAISGAVATAGALATGNFAAAAAGGASAISGTLASLTPCNSMVGGGGGGAYTSQYIASCWTAFHDTTVAPESVSASIGTPAMAQKVIGSLSGYVQTQGASVEVAAEQPIRDKINQLLDGGIFYE